LADFQPEEDIFSNYFLNVNVLPLYETLSINVI